MRKSYFIVLSFFLFITFSIHSQNRSIGSWKDYLSYQKGVSVCISGGRVYCATANGMFYINRVDNSMFNLSKINGLSDIEATFVRTNPSNQKVLISYNNTNLDIVENNGTIVNIPDIKNKPIIGKKTINNVYMEGNLAYLACGFGIVVLDMDREEVKDYYTFDTVNSTINIRDVTTDAQYIYASTNEGVFQALKTSNLKNSSSWLKMNGLPKGAYNTIASVNGKLYANLSKVPEYNKDQVYVYENGAWSLYNFTQWGFICRSLKNNRNRLLITCESSIFLFDDITGASENLYSYNSNGTSKFLGSNEADIDDAGVLWVADGKFGLFKTEDFWNCLQYVPQGPLNPNIYAMCMQGNDLWIIPGAVNQANQNTWNVEGISIKSDEDWKSLAGNQGVIDLDTIFDFVNIIADPLNPKKVYATSYFSGVLEFYDKKPVKLYNATNSSLQSILPDKTTQFIFTYGLAFDQDNNLWVGNTGAPNPLAVMSPKGKWVSPDFAGLLPSNLYVFQVLVDKSNQKWGVIPSTSGGGIFVYKGGPDDKPSSSNTKRLSISKGLGGLVSAGVYCLAEDKDGEIWVGTDKGICVFYNPQNMFSGQNYDAQTIKLEQDGNIQLLLETETVLAIAVDDGNRKWIATANSGVYLMSEDGTKQIHHFDSKTSPLFSNKVQSILIDHKTGEVYFGTDKGLISYRSDAVEGQEYFSEVYAYPNPVKDNYTGAIVIKGLVENTIVKITDISGAIVRELTSIGGQAIWDAKNFKGERVSTGVYMVFCTNTDGSQKIATKIMVIN